MSKLQTISIVIPVYNEDKFIEQVIKNVFHANSCELKKEIIVVNDGSTDSTLKKLLKLKIIHPDLVIINLKVNKGKGYALKQGFLKTSGDLVLVQDADQEYSPNDYPALLEPFLDLNADVVYGSRLSTTKPHRVLFFWHYKVNQFLTFVSNILTGLNLTDMETGFKVFKGDIIRNIAPKLVSYRFGFEPEITARIAKNKLFRIFEVGISYSGRTYQEGKKIGWRDGVLALWEIIRFNLFTRS